MSELPYPTLSYPEWDRDRPYVLLNMVSTLDGKTVSGERDEPVSDLGGAADHATMRQIENSADAVVLGAGSLRATPGLHYPLSLVRVVVSRSGELDFGQRFFTEGGKVFVATEAPLPHGIAALPSQPLALLKALHNLGARRVLLEGGSELNAAFFTEDLVDEVFLTLAPKVKLGRSVPTVAGGDPLPREALRQYSLVSCCPIGDEVFLRYRRAR